ncbi:MAG: type II toxin-antitoxin system HicA family toxin, partial [Pseudonocardiaceae bacterium]
GPGSAAGSFARHGSVPDGEGAAVDRCVEELGYTVTRQSGSHRQLTAEGRPRVTVSYANGDDVPPGVSRKVLARIVGLDEDEAVRLLEGR